MSMPRLGTCTSLALVLAVGAAACREGPKVASSDESIRAGGVTFEVQGEEILHPRPSSADGRTHLYDEGVLAVELKLTNEGKDSVAYEPKHGEQAMTEASTPLLYRDPGSETPLPPKSKDVIPGVVLEKGTLEGQIRGSESIPAGDSIVDTFAFQLPEEKRADLVFSVPPAFHRGTRPVLFRLAYEYREPEAPTRHEVGDAIDLEGVTFRVEGAETRYVELKHAEEGKGFSENPLFAVSYTVENGTDEAITYEPGHTASSGKRAAQLQSGDESFARKRFGSDTTVVDQLRDPVAIPPSDSKTDVALFERPGEEVEELVFRYPGNRFDRAGLVRVRMPYDGAEPDLPKPLREESSEEE